VSHVEKRGRLTTTGLLSRFREGLGRTRDVLRAPFDRLLRSEQGSECLWDEIESALLAADLGVRPTARILQALRDHSARPGETDGAGLRAQVRSEIAKALAAPVAATPPLPPGVPRVVFIVGINGVGKTTTAGKLARIAVSQGASALLCAADTFRAAATEQLVILAERAGCRLQQGKPGADPAAVLTDALRMARAQALTHVIVDTAGRVHTKHNLMEELAKMVRVAGREFDGAPHESLLVLDATVGSNGLSQAAQFSKVVPLTGIILAKMDGTAKGGVAVSIVEALGLPIRYIGVGEGMADLLPFDAEAFATALLGE
jgi:fused signal recognition particle receptor